MKKIILKIFLFCFTINPISNSIVSTQIKNNLSFTTKEKLKNGNLQPINNVNQTSSVLKIYNNIIYVGTIADADGNGKGGVYSKLDNENEFTKIPGIEGDVYSLLITNNGTVYAGTSFKNGMGGFYKYLSDWGEFERIPGIDISVFSLAILKNEETIFLGTNKGVYGYRLKEKSFFNFLGIINEQVWSLAVDYKNQIWAGTLYNKNHGNIYFTPNVKTNFFKKIKFIDAVVFSLLITNNGTVYAGTSFKNGMGGVYSKLDNENEFTKIPGIEGNVYTMLLANDKNSLYIGVKKQTDIAELYFLNKNTIKIQKVQSEIWSLAVNNNNDLFIGTKKGNFGKVYKLKLFNYISFEKKYRFLSHDWLKIKLSYDLVSELISIKKYESKQNNIFSAFYQIIDSLPKYNNTSAFGDIYPSDIKVVVQVIIDHFNDILNIFEKKIIPGEGLIIITNTIGSWDKTDWMGVFEQENTWN